MVTFDSTSEAETRSVGRRLASQVRGGDIVILCGELGAGKTAFVGGLAEGLGIDEPVVSPTFILSRRYEGGFLPLVHVDAYRLGSLNEFEDLGVLEDSQDAVLVVEWGDAVDRVLPDDRLTVTIEIVDGAMRTVRLQPRGSWMGRPLGDLR